jgi:hypothetical protein
MPKQPHIYPGAGFDLHHTICWAIRRKEIEAEHIKFDAQQAQEAA